MNINKYKGKTIRWKNVDMRILSVQRWVTGDDTRYRIKVCIASAHAPKDADTMLITVEDMSRVAAWRREYTDHQYDLTVANAARGAQ